MQNCSDAFSCWLYAHTPPVWLSIVIMVAGVTVLIVWFVVDFRKSLQAMKEERQAREERQRERRMWKHRMMSLVRQAEEWCIDTTPIVDALNLHKQLIEEARKIDRYRTIAMIPLMIVFLFTFIALVLPFFPILMIVCVFTWAPAFIWFLVFIILWEIKGEAFKEKLNTAWNTIHPEAKQI